MEKMPAAGTRRRRTPGGLLCSPLVAFLSFYSHVLLFSGGVSARQIISGVGLSRSSREPRYMIEFHSAGSPFHAGSGQESIVMSKKDGQKYLCYLPLIEEIKSPVVGGDKRAKLKKPDEYMEVLKDRCFYKQEGWWFYEFCHEKSIRQFHPEQDKIIQEFSLGVFDPEATDAFNQNFSGIASVKDPRYKDGSQRYHVHLFNNGTVCDLTNQPRETEVRFICGEHGVAITSIKEVATCKYEVTVQCPLICRHPMFHLERPASHAIHCNEIPRDKKEEEVKNPGIKQVTIVTDTEDEGYLT